MSGAEEPVSAQPGDGGKSLQRVGSLAVLRSAGAFAATVAGRRIAVFSVGDDVVATQGRCPHAKGPIHEGAVLGEMLTCPWHGYTFNLHTGTCEDDPDLILERYDVRIDGDDILVAI